MAGLPPPRRTSIRQHVEGAAFERMNRGETRAGDLDTLLNVALQRSRLNRGRDGRPFKIGPARRDGNDNDDQTRRLSAAFARMANVDVNDSDAFRQALLRHVAPSVAPRSRPAPEAPPERRVRPGRPAAARVARPARPEPAAAARPRAGEGGLPAAPRAGASPLATATALQRQVDGVVSDVAAARSRPAPANLGRDLAALRGRSERHYDSVISRISETADRSERGGEVLRRVFSEPGVDERSRRDVLLDLGARDNGDERIRQLARGLHEAGSLSRIPAESLPRVSAAFHGNGGRLDPADAPAAAAVHSAVVSGRGTTPYALDTEEGAATAERDLRFAFGPRPGEQPDNLDVSRGAVSPADLHRLQAEVLSRFPAGAEPNQTRDVLLRDLPTGDASDAAKARLAELQRAGRPPEPTPAELDERAAARASTLLTPADRAARVPEILRAFSTTADPEERERLSRALLAHPQRLNQPELGNIGVRLAFDPAAGANIPEPLRTAARENIGSSPYSERDVAAMMERWRTGATSNLRDDLLLAARTRFSHDRNAAAFHAALAPRLGGLDHDRLAVALASGLVGDEQRRSVIEPHFIAGLPASLRTPLQQAIVGRLTEHANTGGLMRGEAPARGVATYVSQLRRVNPELAGAIERSILGGVSDSNRSSYLSGLSHADLLGLHRESAALRPQVEATQRRAREDIRRMLSINPDWLASLERAHDDPSRTLYGIAGVRQVSAAVQENLPELQRTNFAGLNDNALRNLHRQLPPGAARQALTEEIRRRGIYPFPDEGPAHRSG